MDPGKPEFRSWGQFHQHPVYPKCKNDSQVISHFTLLGSALEKSVGKMMVKLTPDNYITFYFQSQLVINNGNLL